MSFEQTFGELFQGNPEAHYTWKPGEYNAISRGITEDDIKRHLSGTEPGLLSIPVLPSGLCHFACGDCDRHAEEDEPLDHAEVARKITEFGLPLLVTKSKSPKSGHVWLFFKDKDGFDCANARKLIEKYMKVLGISGEIEVFPKQESLKEDPVTHELQKGSGINLPYFGEMRHGFGKDGEDLAPTEFLVLAHQRQAFGKILRDRDLADNPIVDESQDRTDRPLPIEIIRNLHEKNLKSLQEANQQGHWNDTLNTTAFFAARAFAANALEGKEEDIKKAIRKAASAIDGWNERKMESTLESGWESGSHKPLKVQDKEKSRAEAPDKILAWLDEKLELPVEDVITYLAYHSQLAYETGDLREKCAKKLKIKKSTLDKLVYAQKAKFGENKQLSNVTFLSLDVWPEEVSGPQLLKDIAAYMRRFIFFTYKLDAEVAATWAIGSHVYMEFNIFPRLGVTSPLPECGKTTCLDVLEHLVLRAVRADNISTSIAFRIMEEYKPSLILDETDRYLKENPELIGILNSGHKKDGFVWRTEKINDRQVVSKFGVYGPLAYGMINFPEQTLFSRTIFVQLKRKPSDEFTEDFDKEENPVLIQELSILRHKIVRWTSDHREHLKACKPNTANLINRNRNNWRPLLKVAEVAGGDWTRLLFQGMTTDAPVSKKSDAERLLRDLQNIYYTRRVDRLSSAAIIADLIKQTDSQWARYHRGMVNIDQCELADLLGEFNITPKSLRYSGQLPLPTASKQEIERAKAAAKHFTQKRGYEARDLEPLYKMYLTDGPEEVDVSSEPY